MVMHLIHKSYLWKLHDKESLLCEEVKDLLSEIREDQVEEDEDWDEDDIEDEDDSQDDE